jgi:hypothetical protein
MFWAYVVQFTDSLWAVVMTVTNFWVPWKVENFLTSLVTVSSSRRTLIYGASLLVSYLG